MPVRQPIVCVLGHVDTGKTLLLDNIRKSSVQEREVGGMTQHIGASFFPLETLMKICGPLLEKLKGKIQIPGLLIIDTPGHEAFANLRKRGGGAADIAILVIDVLKGFEAQTYECIDILKARKTPFLVAVNKVDRIAGWKSNPEKSFLASYESQDPYVKEDLDNRLYTIMGEFSRQNFRVDRFDKITDFTRTVALVPVSAKTGEGIPELLAVLVGLTQQYLTSELQVTKGPAKGTVLEVKEEPGLGITVNAVIYDGVLQKGDAIVIGGKEKPIVTRTRAILLPKPLDEIRDPRDKFTSVDSVAAAVGVKIVAPDLDNALAGAPLYVIPDESRTDEYVRMVSEEVQRVKIATDIEGVVLKTDALGSLEAIAESLKRVNVPIRLADVGDVSKRDVTEALVVKEHEPLYGAILAFNVKVLPDAEAEAKDHELPIFKSNVIYHLVDDYTTWLKNQQETQLQKEYEQLIKPGKIVILPGYVFRKARPAIVGVEVLGGRIQPKYTLVKKDGADVGEISQIQDKGQTIHEARISMQVAISLEKPIVGRHIDEKDILYVKIPENHAKILQTKFKEKLTVDEQEVFEEYLKLMRKKVPFWAA
ncbi:MAG: translation initiation factor IF-2 [Candidatus Bathyarchaeia archaeon]|nr:translation initiation factor IF-2 [Candidatus Bathyarchaeota archaeon A05DMB-4]MDH7595423.1 translation initiation factor IF-2 [Candidatus Bathyarchaeota archaeon]